MKRRDWIDLIGLAVVLLAFWLIPVFAVYFVDVALRYAGLIP